MRKLSLIILFVQISSISCLPYYVFLLRNDSDYTIHHNRNNTWDSVSFSTEVTLGDIAFDYSTNDTFYFPCSSPPNKKGIYQFALPPTNQFIIFQSFSRNTSLPQKLEILAEYNLMFLYDYGYKSVLAVHRKKGRVMTRVYFEEVDPIGLQPNANGRPFFVDRKSTKLIGTTTKGSIYRADFNQSTPEELSAKLPSDTVSVSAFDPETSVLFFKTQDGQLSAFNLASGGQVLKANDNLQNCAAINAGNGAIHCLEAPNKLRIFSYVESEGKIQLTSKEELTTLNFDASQLVSFKVYDSALVTSQCPKCTDLCMPTGPNSNESSCTCADFRSKVTPTSSCTQSKLDPCFVILEDALVPGHSDISWLQGETSHWLKRPVREYMKAINSKILAISSKYSADKIFAVEEKLRQIFNFDVTGTKVYLTPFNQISPSIKSIAYDWVGNNIVWYDPALHLMKIVSLHPSQLSPWKRKIHYASRMVMPDLEGYSLAMDANWGYVFFLDLEEVKPEVKLIRSTLNGTEADSLHSFSTNYFDANIDDTNPDHPLPGSLTVDPEKQMVWVAFVNRIFRLTYGGTIICNQSLTAEGFKLENSRISGIAALKTDNGTQIAVAFSNFNGTTKINFYSEDISDNNCVSLLGSRPVKGNFHGLTVYQPFPKTNVSCLSLGCSHMCVVVNKEPTCICPDYHVMAEDGSCVEDANLGGPSVLFSKSGYFCRFLADQLTKAKGASILDNYNIICSKTEGETYQNIAPAHMLNSFFYNEQATKNVIRSKGLGSLATESEVTKLRGDSSIKSIVYDGIARNVYALVDDGIAVFKNALSNFPKVIYRKSLISAIAVDEMNRHLYRVEGTTVIRSDLAAQNDCRFETASVSKLLQLAVSYANNSLLVFMENSTLAELPLNGSCSETAKFNKKQITEQAGKVSRVGVYKQLLVMLTDQAKLYSSSSLGKSLVQQKPVDLKGPVESLHVIDPYINYTRAENNKEFHRCEQLCLNNTCICETGMKLLSNQKHCGPKKITLNSSTVIIAADQYHRKVFAFPLDNGADLTHDVLEVDEPPLTSFKIHRHAKPNSLAFDTANDVIYYIDTFQQSLKSIDTNEQMFSSRFVESVHISAHNNELKGFAFEPVSRSFIFSQHGKVVSQDSSGSTKDLISNEKMNFYGIAMDSNKRIFVAGVSNGNPSSVTIYKVGIDGGDSSVLQTVSIETDSSLSESFYELTFDAKTNRLYMSLSGTLGFIVVDSQSSKSFTELTERMKSKLYRGIAVANGHLLAADTDGGVDVLDSSNGGFVSSIGNQYFFGLSSLIVVDRDSIATSPVTAEVTTTTATSSIASSNPASSSTVPSSPTTVSTTTTTTTTTTDKSEANTTLSNSTTTQSAGASSATGSFSSLAVGVIIGLVIVAIVTIVIFIFCRRRPKSRGFQRLEVGDSAGLDRYFRMEDEETFGTDATEFRNPVYNMQEISANISADESNSRQYERHRSDMDILDENYGGL